MTAANTTARQQDRYQLQTTADPQATAKVQQTRALNTVAHSEARKRQREQLSVVATGIAGQDAEAISPPARPPSQRETLRLQFMGEDGEVLHGGGNGAAITNTDAADDAADDADDDEEDEAAGEHPSGATRRRRRVNRLQRSQCRTSPTALLMPLFAGDNEHDVATLYEDDAASEEILSMAASTMMYRTMAAAVAATNNSSDEDDAGDADTVPREVVDDILAEYRDAQRATEGA